MRLDCLYDKPQIGGMAGCHAHNLGQGLSVGFQHTSSVHTHHKSSKHVETDKRVNPCVFTNMSHVICTPRSPIQLSFEKKKRNKLAFISC